MKRILSVLLALVMVIGMLPMSILTASAATKEVVFNLGADGAATHADGSENSTYSETVEGYTLSLTGGSKMYTGARDAKGNGCIKLGTSKATGSFTFTVPSDVTSVVIQIAKYKANTSKVTINDATTTLTNSSNDGAYDEITVDTSTTKTVSVTTVSGGVRAMVNSITFVCEDTSADCLHSNTTNVEQVDATCTEAGYTAGVFCEDCKTYTEGHEEIAALGHKETTVVTDPTCTEAGFTTYTCSVCNNVRTGDTVAANGHTFEGDTCVDCGVVKLDLSKATSIKVGNVVVFVCEDKTMEMNGFEGTSYACGESYTEAPIGLNAWTVVAGSAESTYAFEMDGKYLSWTSGNSATTSDTINSNSSWTVSFDENGNAIVTNAADATRNLRWNATSPRFACYTSAQTAIQLYVKACEHNYTSVVTEPTCGADGYTTYTCSLCGDEYTDNVVEATGHSYGEDHLCTVCGERDPEACAHENKTTATENATCTEAGSVTVTCDDCGEVISIEEIAATGHTEVVDEAVAATCTKTGLTAGSHCSVCSEVIVAQTETEALGHSYVDGTCSVCSEAEPAEDVKIVFELGEDKDTTTHADGSSASEYSETVDDYTLSITGGVKMYTGANDAKGNGCIKLGTGSAVASFSFTVPSDVISVVINVAGYKANTVTVTVNGTSQAISTKSNNGEYTAITVDTITNKTITFATTSTGYRAMVNSITFICGETDHECQWDEGVVTTAATCTTDGVMTYTCTVDGCTMTETIKATGHTYVYGESAITCANCDYNKAYTLNTIAEAKAYTDTSVVYYLKGVVTYVNAKNVYIEDATGGVCVYFATADDTAGIAVGDEIVVWDTMTKYNGLIETSNTTAQEFLKVSSGNELPSKVVTIADLLADTTNEYLGERVVIENVTIGVLGTNNTALTDASGNTINIYKAPALSEEINENDVVTVTAVVSTHNGYQLFVNSADDVVKIASGEEVVVETVTIAEAIAGTAGEYYQVEGVVTYVDGRNVYMQDATGGIVVYLTANATTTQVGDMVKAYGALKNYNGLLELDAVDETNVKFYEILSSGNTVETQNVTIAELNADTAYGFHAEKVSLTGVYVSYYSYSSSYGNVDYTLNDGNGNTIKISRVKVASEAECIAAGSIVNVDANVSVYNGSGVAVNQLVTSNDKIVVTGTCGHENTELVNAETATCTEAGYTGDTKCTVCGYYTVRGEEIPATGHSYDANGVCANGCGIVNVAGVNGAFYTTFEAAYAAAEQAQYIKLLADVEFSATLSKNLYIDLNGKGIEGEIVMGEFSVCAIDSVTTDYKTVGGYLGLTVNGGLIEAQTEDGYVMYEGDSGWTFNAYELAITHVSLDANKDALGYKAELKGNEYVQTSVTSYGFVMGVVGRENKEKTYEAQGVIDDGVFTLRLNSIMKFKAGEKEIVASAFVVFNEDTENKVSTKQYTTSMKATLLAVNEMTNLSDAQKAAVYGLYEKYAETMNAWLSETNNIKDWAPVVEEVPSEPETSAE